MSVSKDVRDSRGLAPSALFSLATQPTPPSHRPEPPLLMVDGLPDLISLYTPEEEWQQLLAVWDTVRSSPRTRQLDSTALAGRWHQAHGTVRRRRRIVQPSSTSCDRRGFATAVWKPRIAPSRNSRTRTCRKSAQHAAARRKGQVARNLCHVWDVSPTGRNRYFKVISPPLVYKNARVKASRRGPLDGDRK